MTIKVYMADYLQLFHLFLFKFVYAWEDPYGKTMTAEWENNYPVCLDGGNVSRKHDSAIQLKWVIRHQGNLTLSAYPMK